MDDFRVSLKRVGASFYLPDDEFANLEPIRPFVQEQLARLMLPCTTIASATAATVCWFSSNGVRVMAHHGFGHEVYAHSIQLNQSIFAPNKSTVIDEFETLDKIQTFLGVRGFKNILAVPMFSHQGKRLGALMLFFQNQATFTDQQIQALEQVVELTMMSIRTAQIGQDFKKTTSLYPEAIAQAKDSVIEFDHDLNILVWNQGAQETYGYSIHEIRSFEQIVPTEEKSRLRALMQQLEQNQNIAPHEVIRLHKSGFHIQVRSSLSPVRDLNQKVIGFVEFSGIPTDSQRSAAIDRLKELIAVLPLMFWQTDSEGKFTFVEGQFLGQVNESRHALIGVNASDFFVGYPKIQQAIEDSLSGARMHEITNWQGRNYEYWTEPILQQGKFTGCNALVLDITERQATEQRLEQSQSDLAMVLNQLPLLMVRASPQGQIVSMAGGALEQSRADGTLAKHRAQPGNQLANDLSEAPEGLALFAQAAQGQTVNGLVNWRSQVFDTWVQPEIEDGQVKSLVAIALDVTARVKAGEQQQLALKQMVSAQSQLAQQQAFANIVLSTIEQGVAVSNKTGELEYVSERYAKMLGYEEQDLLGKSLFDLIPAEDREILQQARLERSEGWTSRYQHRAIRKDGSIALLEVTGYPRLNHRQQKTGSIAVVRDISVEAEFDQEFQALKQKLEQETAFALQVTSTINQGLVSLDQTGQVVFANPRTARLAGVEDVKDLIGKNPIELVPPEQRAAVIQEWRYLFKGQTRTYRHSVARADQQELKVEITVYPKLNPDNTFAGAFMTVTDITQMLQLEQAAHQARRAMEHESRIAAKVAQTIKQGLAVLNRDAHFEFVNPALANMLQKSPETLIGVPFLSVVAPKELQRLEDMRQNMSILTSNVYFAQLQNAAGEEFPVEIGYYPQVKENRFDGAVLVVSNLSEQIAQELEVLRVSNTMLEYEKAMKLQEQKSNLLLESIDQGVAVFDATGRIEYFNPAYAKMLEYEPEELLENENQLVYSQDLPLLEQAVELRKQNQSSTYTIRMVQQSGSIIEVEVSGYPRFLGEKYFGSMVIARNLTERNKHDKELLQANKRLLMIDEVRNYIASAKNNQELFRDIVNAVNQVLGYELVSLFLLEQDHLVLQHSIGYGEDEPRFPMTSQGAVVRSARERKVMLISDARLDPDYYFADPRIRSELCVPIVTQDAVLGVLNLEHIEVNAFDQSDVMLLQAVAERIADKIVLTDMLDRLRLLDWANKESEKQSATTLNQQILFLPNLEMALQFMRGVGGEVFFVASFEIPVNAIKPKLILRGRGFVLVVAKGNLQDLPDSIQRQVIG